MTPKARLECDEKKKNIRITGLLKAEADFEYRAPMISVDQIISPAVFAFKAVEV